MNWMGGNLSRHRRGKGWKEEMARQKEYFAKARSRRQQGRSQTRVILSATDFIPNYISPTQKPTTSLHGAEASPSLARSPSALCGRPVSAAAEVSTSLGDRPESLTRDVTRLPTAFSLGENRRLPLSSQTVKDRPIGPSDPAAGFPRLLERIDSAGTEMPRLPDLQAVEERGYSTIFRHTSERQQQLGASSGHHKPEGGRQRDNRKRKMRQATPSPKSMRIRVGSQDYRWSKSRGSIGTATFDERSQMQSTASEETRSKLRSTYANGASRLFDEPLTESSSSSTGHPALSSPCGSRASRLREHHNSMNQVREPSPKETERQLPDCACVSAPKSPTSAPSISETDSTDSIAVQASDDELMAGTEMDEERIWRQWLR